MTIVPVVFLFSFQKHVFLSINALIVFSYFLSVCVSQIKSTD